MRSGFSAPSTEISYFEKKLSRAGGNCLIEEMKTFVTQCYSCFEHCVLSYTTSHISGIVI